MTASNKGMKAKSIPAPPFKDARRERIATEVFAVLASRSGDTQHWSVSEAHAETATQAVRLADALIEALDA